MSNVLSHFWVVTVLSNPNRYRRRYELYSLFKEMCQAGDAKLITVELALGDRPFEITDASNPRHVQLRGIDELWYKENLIDLGVKRASELDPHIGQVAWIDADIRPMRLPSNWFQETWHQLQHYEFVQMFDSLVNLDYDFGPLDGPANGFAAGYIRGLKHPPVNPSSGFWYGAPGGAWAANISAFRNVGGLIDFCILGSADWHQAQGLVGILEPHKKSGETWSDGYAKALYNWQERALRWIKKDIGYVSGTVMHDNHGPKSTRNYVGRKQILKKFDYDPATDLKYDHQGLLQLETWSDRQIGLRDAIRDYFRSRNEDMPEYRK